MSEMAGASIATLYRRASYGGRRGRSAARKLRLWERGLCPICGGALDQGYGCMGGGVGTYTVCSRNVGHYFDKVEDAAGPGCRPCRGSGWRDGVVPPRVGDDPLHPFGRCTCGGEMNPECPYCRYTCQACMGNGE